MWIVAAGVLFLLFLGVGCGEISAPYSPSRGDRDPTWSPTGPRIAFVRVGKEDAGEIYVVDSDGSHLRKLTNSNAKPYPPIWSPDGTRIAFDSLDGLTITNADGGNPRTAEDGLVPDWSPDGQWIAFDRGDGIDVEHVADRKSRRLVRRGENPAWSPDGTSIAFTRPVGNHSRIFVIGANGTGLHRLSEASDYTDTAWSPDSTSIAFTRRVPNGYRIVVARANGTAVREVTTASYLDDGYPRFAWSPDGRWIAFDRRYAKRHGVQASILAIRVADGKIRRLVRDGLHWAWSPDGHAIGFIRHGHLYTVNSGSLRVTRFPDPLPQDVATPSAYPIDQFAWSPDSREIVLSAYGRLFVVAATDGQIRDLTDGGF